MPGTISIKTINHVGIPVWDRRVSLKFYRDILGLQVIPSMVDSPNIVWTKTLDGTMVHLIEPSDGENLVDPHIAFEVADFDSAVEALRASGYPEISDTGERHDGQKCIFINDNDGNRLEFATASNLRSSSRVADALGYTTETGENVVVDSPSKIKILTINHVGLGVNDRAECMGMYRDLLNINVIPHQIDGNTLTWTEMPDGSMVHVIDPPQSVGPRGDGRQHVAFEVEDIEATAEALIEADIEIVEGIGTRHDGQQFLFIYDPDGNRIEIATRGDHSDTPRTADENGYTSEDGVLL
ncbi:MAG: VOC family protein [Chloroflexi bacterium]|jgi:catechol 2,3-dioxygenase-like lactoylglutathione lyase family enzyme|nr:VOC family protein [Chloroflexota bacterium]MBT5627961.1 VOC family protein [Chloroflexota bacterium]